jgi:hypothetical protein
MTWAGPLPAIWCLFVQDSNCFRTEKMWCEANGEMWAPKIAACSCANSRIGKNKPANIAGARWVVPINQLFLGVFAPAGRPPIEGGGVDHLHL